MNQYDNGDNEKLGLKEEKRLSVCRTGEGMRLHFSSATVVSHHEVIEVHCILPVQTQSIHTCIYII